MKAAIFDLDGTLVDSMPDISAACNYAMAGFSFPPYSVEKYKTLAGGGNTRLITRTLRTHLHREPTAEEVERGVALKVEYENTPVGHEHTYAFKGIAEMLRNLADNGIILAVLSNKTEHLVRKIVARCFPDIKWVYVAGARDDTPLKPDPTAAFRLVENYMPGIDYKDIAFVGDTDYDMKTAISTGMVPLAVSWGCRTSEQLQNLGAAAVVDDAAHIGHFILGGGKMLPDTIEHPLTNAVEVIRVQSC